MTRKAILAVLTTLVAAPALHAQTFTFGGYVKLDVLSTKYHDGAPPPEGPLRDFHFPAQIPVGGATDIFGETSSHAKESRWPRASSTGCSSPASTISVSRSRRSEGDEARCGGPAS